MLTVGHILILFLTNYYLVILRLFSILSECISVLSMIKEYDITNLIILNFTLFLNQQKHQDYHFDKLKNKHSLFFLFIMLHLVI